MQNGTVDLLSKNNANKVNTNKSSRNNHEKKLLRLALFCPIMLVTILVKVPVDTAFFMWVDAHLLMFS